MGSDLARAGWFKQRPPVQLPCLALIDAFIKLKGCKAYESG
jgi:hypothetical protein